ncbi:MAG: tetratricopeptide repeat protein [candidate division Zixibacteria bacterium]|nr:tetratricopeptide repeat protein [candidate division Zixibacteria bacterium]
MGEIDTETKPERVNYKLCALLIFALGFILRLFHLLDFQSSPIFTYLILDPGYYHKLALAIAGGNIIGSEVFFKAPLYPYFLAAIYALFGESIFIARLIQIILGSFSCVLIYLLARHFYASKIAVTAGIIAALYGPLIMFDSELLIPVLVIFLNLLSILLLLKYEDSGNKWTLFISALILGLSGLARPNVLILVPGVIFWLYRYCRKSKPQWKKSALLYVVGVVIMLVPLVARNYAVSGQLVLFGNYGGYNFLIGNNAQADGKTAILPGTSPDFQQGYLDAVKIANRISGRNLSTGELGWVWFKLGFDFISSNPLAWLGLESKKLVYLISAFELPNNRHICFFAARSPVLKALLWDKYVSLPFGILLPLALVAVAARQVRRDQFPLYFFVIAYSLSILLFFVTSRFRLPVIPIMIIWGAAGGWSIWQTFRQKKYRRLGRLLAIFLAAAILGNGLTYLSPFSVRPPTEYESHLLLGDAYYAAGEYHQARAELFAAARLYAKSPRVFNSLGNTHRALGENLLAIEYYQRGIAADSSYEPVKRSLASLYKHNNNIGDLYDLVQAEVIRNPTCNWALKEYAHIHTLMGELSLAADLYEQAFQADTTDFEALFKKAEALLNQDLRQEAEREYRRLLEYQPNSIEAHANLGQVYARQNRLQDALAEFLWVAEHDPDNPASYFNLASAYFQMKNFDKAEKMLIRVVEINPHFASVNRLRQMIEEGRKAASGN